jgi:hypothetical protein
MNHICTQVFDSKPFGKSTFMPVPVPEIFGPYGLWVLLVELTPGLPNSPVTQESSM